MKNQISVLLGCVIILSWIAGSSAFGESWMWAKGNLHCHTTNSDGDSSPQVVADWYRTHGYQFLAISDHNKLTEPSSINNPSPGSFVLIPGEELYFGPGKVIDTAAIGSTKEVVCPPRATTTSECIQDSFDAIRAAGAIPMICHMNYGAEPITHRDLLPVTGRYMLEVFNGYPSVRNSGDLASLSHEQTWDVLLSNGRTVYAVASDDAHSFVEGATVGISGLGWIFVRVNSLTVESILNGLRRGDFYASTGVTLSDYKFDGKQFSVQVAPDENCNYLIRFIGKWGSILQETDGTSAVYKITDKREKDGYVRCKVIRNDGKVAWTQAFRLKP